MAKCYMCDNESTSVEHVPPRCFFPKDMRLNLYTVPACKIHNEDTSKDDEYARNIITMSIENNQTSIDHFFSKSFSSLKRSSALANAIISTLKDVSFYKENAKSIQIDRRRFDRTIRKVAYALFYQEFGYTWERLLAVTTNQIKMGDMSNDHLGDIFDSLSVDLDKFQLKGNNPLIFQYTFFDFTSEKYNKALFMIFYEVYITIEKYTIFQLKSIPVLIDCEDKKSYLNAG